MAQLYMWHLNYLLFDLRNSAFFISKTIAYFLFLTYDREPFALHYGVEFKLLLKLLGRRSLVMMIKCGLAYTSGFYFSFVVSFTIYSNLDRRVKLHKYLL